MQEHEHYPSYNPSLEDGQDGIIIANLFLHHAKLLVMALEVIFVLTKVTTKLQVCFQIFESYVARWKGKFDEKRWFLIVDLVAHFGLVGWQE